MTVPVDAGADRAPASSSCTPAPQTLTKRADFLAAARARRAAVPGFVLQGRDRADGSAQIRVGFTASRKVGNAVARNRAKRRLRALVREILPGLGRPGWDYVLIARKDATGSLPFEALCADLARALKRVHPKAASSTDLDRTTPAV